MFNVFFVVKHSKSKIEEVYDKSMEVLEKEGNYKNAAKLYKRGGGRKTMV